jgi:hypothetical protein
LKFDVYRREGGRVLSALNQQRVKTAMAGLADNPRPLYKNTSELTSFR